MKKSTTLLTFLLSMFLFLGCSSQLSNKVSNNNTDPINRSVEDVKKYFDVELNLNNYTTNLENDKQIENLGNATVVACKSYGTVPNGTISNITCEYSNDQLIKAFIDINLPKANISKSEGQDTAMNFLTSKEIVTTDDSIEILGHSTSSNNAIECYKFQTQRYPKIKVYVHSNSKKVVGFSLYDSNDM